MTHRIAVAKLYTELVSEPNRCTIEVPSGKGIYMLGNVGAVDTKDVKFDMSWNDMLRNSASTVDEKDLEVGSILLSDGLHKVFLTWTYRLYVDNNTHYGE